MVRSLLDLPDEPLCLIFRALDSHILRGLRASHESAYAPAHPFVPNVLCSSKLCSPDPRIPYESFISVVSPDTNGTRERLPPLAGRALASSCSRLNAIHRTTVDELTLVKSYSEEECERLWTRYPCITALDLCLRYVPGSIRDDVSPLERLPVPASNFFSLLARSNAQPPLSPSAYPLCMVRSNVKKLTIHGARMQLCELREIIESCAALESLQIYETWLFLDKKPRDCAANLCSVSLEKHAPSLRHLSIRNCEMMVFGVLYDRGRSPAHLYLDLRWFQVAKLMNLHSLTLGSLRLDAGPSLLQITGHPSLKSLSLFGLSVSAEELDDILPSLPKLRSVDFDDVDSLDGNILHWLPAQRDPSGGRNSWPATSLDLVSADCVTQPFWRIGAHLSVKKLRFKDFLRPFAGASITCLDLTAILSNSCEDLVFLLSRTPNLLELKLRNPEVMESVFFEEEITNLCICRSISQLPCLRTLTLGLIVPGNIANCIEVLASGPCRDSLHLADLRQCHVVDFEDASDSGFCAFVFVDDGVVEFHRHFGDRCAVYGLLYRSDAGYLDLVYKLAD